MENLLKFGNIISKQPIPFAWSLFLKTESLRRNAAGNRAHIIITRTRTILIITPIPITIHTRIIIRIDTTIPTATPVTGGNTNHPSRFTRSEAGGLPIGLRAQPACAKPRLVQDKGRSGWGNDLGFLRKSLPLLTIFDVQ
jgi:hypothetical protein